MLASLLLALLSTSLNRSLALHPAHADSQLVCRLEFSDRWDSITQSYVKSFRSLATFPLAGGAVHWQVEVTRIRDVVARLYSPDGTSQLYPERIEQREEYEFTGHYSGGGQGTFTEGVYRGKVEVYIYNSSTPSFDRGYTYLVSGSWAGERSANGNLSMSASREVPTLVDIREPPIANTQWERPTLNDFGGSMELQCQGTRAVEMLPPPRLPAPVTEFSLKSLPPPYQGPCGPIQLLYFDQVGASGYPKEIDMVVERLLEEAPNLSLIISNRGRLEEKFGEEGFQRIEDLLYGLGALVEACPFILIVGGHDVVPFATLPNPTNDGDTLYSDDPYGDQDHDLIPDLPVARLPDGGELDLLIIQLSAPHPPQEGDLTLSNSNWKSAAEVAKLFGGEKILWSLPTIHTDLTLEIINAEFDFFLLHGDWQAADLWRGEEPQYPIAFTTEEANSQGLVLTGSCYGAYILDKSPQDSIALAFLKSGARAYIGSTGLTYFYGETLERGDYLMYNLIIQDLSRGLSPLEAFSNAKRAYAQEVLYDGEEKNLHQFVYYGKP